MRFTAIDIETTGLGPEKARIIEIGAVKYENGEQKEIFSTLVNLQTDGIPERITELTGITDEMLRGAPEEAEAMRSLLRFLAGEEVLLGHNILFDFSFLKVAAGRIGETFDYQGIDTLFLARQCRPELPKKTLTALCEEYAIATECAHRAEEDAVAAAQLYFHLLEQFGEEHGEYFAPKLLEYYPKKTEPATKRQCSYLKAIIAAHGLDLVPDYGSLTKSEASRLIDKLLAKHGRVR
ncbi:MAG: exonuclease domain-containing protein [Lachnospiraceae bacterium]|nr:exonuclease domain-containing protein [Lachnospiraceae bacterium]